MTWLATVWIRRTEVEVTRWTVITVGFRYIAFARASTSVGVTILIVPYSSLAVTTALRTTVNVVPA